MKFFQFAPSVHKMSIFLVFSVLLVALYGWNETEVCLSTTQSAFAFLDGKYETLGNCGQYPLWQISLPMEDDTAMNGYLVEAYKMAALDDIETEIFGFYQCSTLQGITSGMDSQECMFMDMYCDTAPVIYCIPGYYIDYMSMETKPTYENKTYKDFDDCTHWHAYDDDGDSMVPAEVTLNLKYVQSGGTCPSTNDPNIPSGNGGNNNNNGGGNNNSPNKSKNNNSNSKQQTFEENMWVWLGVIVIILAGVFVAFKYGKKTTTKIKEKLEEHRSKKLSSFVQIKDQIDNEEADMNDIKIDEQPGTTSTIPKNEPITIQAPKNTAPKIKQGLLDEEPIEEPVGTDENPTVDEIEMKDIPLED